MNRNITSLILIILAAGIYFTFTQGQIDAAKEVSNINEQYASAIENSKQLIKLRDTVNSAYNKLTETDRERLNKILPSSANNIHLIVDLSDMAGARGLTLKNIKAEAVSEGQRSVSAVAPGALDASSIIDPTLASVRVTFDVNASYDQFIQFLRDLESSLRILDLARLTIKASDSGVYDYGVELRTYWLKQ